MDSIIKLTILFNEPFWVGIFEAMDGYELKVCKVTFGAEPRDEEVHEFILMNFYRLNFSGSVRLEKTELALKKKNPKRLQRSIKKEISAKEIGTKAQIAMKLQHDQLKQERKEKTKEQKLQEEERKFNIRQRKKLDKHKGH
ncbi:YjdF family protein [Clostridium sp. YIM B02505]|uniref:YjdF family protein n=1 Tax=Clostridium yunnanense TaxID=2800325 RepID=A0ABS1ER30_9CLOT|nr:YjdF family protein [Clostridium yunnanense]MBK1811790.1 YjdF family protein [Clostridium yunnanense]